MTWQTITTALAFLWWAFWLVLLAGVLIGALWSRRPWRPDPAKAWRLFQAESVRKFEERELAELASKGDLWTPDRRKRP